ncbi:hypothetical protein [Pandoraea aquatica]|nr:hypothetical protein [Pandoraea aquatica]
MIAILTRASLRACLRFDVFLNVIRCVARRAVSRPTSPLVGLAIATSMTGCAAMAPGNWQVFGPPPSYVRPAPVIVGPAPAIVQPAPVVVTPAPVIVAPPPAVIQPAPVLVTPAPALVRPAPVIVQPAPVIVGPRQPVVIVPAQPRSSRDAAHFLRERCYLEKGGCYTSEYREGYEFDPSTGTWGWVGRRDYRWKGSRGNR